ncbi:hypothetical protein [Thalassotalea sediminis]|uniref:hypothetical protein n=1 Tax=Thalassotalea sediminis TaxID=1759089 RepID=UPI00257472EE|nr:hypothetical protein [Thalassotalea sediminis]
MMKLPKITSAIFFTTIATYAIAEATPKTNESLNIYVYNNCQQLAVIPMTDSQISAYKAFKATEVGMANAEKPLSAMEDELAKYQAELEKLSNEMIIETNEKIVMNKALLKKHERLADKIENIISKHKPNFDNLDVQVEQIETAAKSFERAIQPSIAKYKNENDNIQVNISSTGAKGYCKT